jgi:hypothetical protein
MYLLAGLLLVGFICNWLIRQVAEAHHMTPNELAEEKKGVADIHPHFVKDVSALLSEVSQSWRIFLAWLAFWIPLGWGGWMTVQKAIVFFK